MIEQAILTASHWKNNMSKYSTKTTTNLSSCQLIQTEEPTLVQYENLKRLASIDHSLYYHSFIKMSQKEDNAKIFNEIFNCIDSLILLIEGFQDFTLKYRNDERQKIQDFGHKSLSTISISLSID